MKGCITLKIREVIEKLNDGMKAAALVKKLGLADKRMREELKTLGFEYSNSNKTWGGNEQSQQYIDNSLYLTMFHLKIIGV